MLSRKQLQVLNGELHKEFGMTTIFVTAIRMKPEIGDRIVVLQDGEIRQWRILEMILKALMTDFGSRRSAVFMTNLITTCDRLVIADSSISTFTVVTVDFATRYFLFRLWLFLRYHEKKDWLLADWVFFRLFRSSLIGALDGN